MEIIPTEVELLHVNHQIDMDDKVLNTNIETIAWRSCCFELHPESSRFCGKFTISLVIICICGYQLVVHTENCTAQVGYSSLLSLVIGTWLKI